LTNNFPWSPFPSILSTYFYMGFYDILITWLNHFRIDSTILNSSKLLLSLNYIHS
jgi:hypothetical protein